MRFLHCVLAVASMIGIACDGSPARPGPDGFSSTVPLPPAPLPPAPISGVGTIVVELLPYTHDPCTPWGREACEARWTVIIDDSDRVKTFTGPGKMTWPDIPAGSHRLYIYNAYFLPDGGECRFFWVATGQSAGAPLEVVLRGGETQTFQVSFRCI